jgi:hypothetical protein
MTLVKRDGNVLGTSHPCPSCPSGGQSTRECIHFHSAKCSRVGWVGFDTLHPAARGAESDCNHAAVHAITPRFAPQPARTSGFLKSSRANAVQANGQERRILARSRTLWPDLASNPASSLSPHSDVLRRFPRVTATATATTPRPTVVNRLIALTLTRLTKAVCETGRALFRRKPSVAALLPWGST